MNTEQKEIILKEDETSEEVDSNELDEEGMLLTLSEKESSTFIEPINRSFESIGNQTLVERLTSNKKSLFYEVSEVHKEEYEAYHKQSKNRDKASEEEKEQRVKRDKVDHEAIQFRHKRSSQAIRGRLSMICTICLKRLCDTCSQDDGIIAKPHVSIEPLKGMEPVTDCASCGKDVSPYLHRCTKLEKKKVNKKKATEGKDETKSKKVENSAACFRVYHKRCVENAYREFEMPHIPPVYNSSGGLGVWHCPLCLHGKLKPKPSPNPKPISKVENRWMSQQPDPNNPDKKVLKDWFKQKKLIQSKRKSIEIQKESPVSSKKLKMDIRAFFKTEKRVEIPKDEDEDLTETESDDDMERFIVQRGYDDNKKKKKKKRTMKKYAPFLCKHVYIYRVRAYNPLEVFEEYDIDEEEFEEYDKADYEVEWTKVKDGTTGKKLVDYIPCPKKLSWRPPKEEDSHS